MMDSDEGGMSLAGREEEDMADQGGVESFRRVSWYNSDLRSDSQYRFKLHPTVKVQDSVLVLFT